MREDATKLMATLMAAQTANIRLIGQDDNEVAEQPINDPALQIVLETFDWHEPQLFQTETTMGKKDRAQFAAAKRNINSDQPASETRQQRRARERKEAKK